MKILFFKLQFKNSPQITFTLDIRRNMKNGNSKEEVRPTPAQSKWTRTYNDTYNKKFKEDLRLTQKQGLDRTMPKQGSGDLKRNEPVKTGTQPLVQFEDTVKLEDQGDSLYQDTDEQSIIDKGREYERKKMEVSRKKKSLVSIQTTLADSRMTGVAAGQEAGGILKEVQYGAGGNTISLHRIDNELLAGMMGGLRGDLVGDQSLAVMQKAQMKAERLQRLAVGVPVDTMDELHEPKAQRPILQIDRPLAINSNEGIDSSSNKGNAVLGPSGSALQTRYVEQWINAVLKDAQEMQIPGVMKRPEAQNPIQRYDLDRLHLERMGMSLEFIDRVYRALFTHSVGFFQLLKEGTKEISEGKATVISNLWQVFQLLLQYACPTDFKMVTTVMEEKHQVKVSSLEGIIQEINANAGKKDLEVKEKLAKLAREFNLMEEQKQQIQNERIQIYQELQNLQKKLEDEIRLRLYFESKLNSLHHINMDHESRRELLGERHTKLEVEHHKLVQKYEVMKEEYEELVKFRDEAKQRLLAQDLEGSYREKALEVHHEKIEDFQSTIQKHQEEITECKHELDLTIVKYTSAQMKVQELENDVESKENYAKQIKNVYDHTQEELAAVQTLTKDQVAQLKKQSKTMARVQQENTLLERENRVQRTDLVAGEEQIAQLTEERDTWQQKFTCAELAMAELNQVLELERKNNDVQDANLTKLTAVKHDLESKLGKQLAQTETMMEHRKHLERLYKNVKTESLFTAGRLQGVTEELNAADARLARHEQELQEMTKLQEEKELNFRLRLNNQEYATDVEQTKLKNAAGQLASSKDEVRKLQIMVNDLQVEQSALQAHHAMTSKQLADVQKHRDDLQLEFAVYKRAHEYVVLDTEKIKNELALAREVHREEVSIYAKKLTQLQKQLDIAQMPLEDAQAQQLRLEEKCQRLVDGLNNQQEDMRFLRKNYVAFLIQKQWSKLTADALRKEIRENNEELARQMKIMAEIKQQLEILNKYKDDMQRDKAILGEQMVDLMGQLQVSQEKNQKLVHANEELHNEIAELEKKYSNDWKQEQGTQTHDFEFLQLRIAFAGCQTDISLGSKEVQGNPFRKQRTIKKQAQVLPSEIDQENGSLRTKENDARSKHQGQKSNHSLKLSVGSQEVGSNPDQDGLKSSLAQSVNQQQSSKGLLSSFQSKSPVAKTFLRNPENGELIEHKEGEVVPPGWDLVKKICKKKSKRAPSDTKAKVGPTSDADLAEDPSEREAEHRQKSKQSSKNDQSEVLAPGRGSSRVKKDQESKHGPGQDELVNEYQELENDTPEQRQDIGMVAEISNESNATSERRKVKSAVKEVKLTRLNANGKPEKGRKGLDDQEGSSEGFKRTVEQMPKAINVQSSAQIGSCQEKDKAESHDQESDEEEEYVEEIALDESEIKELNRVGTTTGWLDDDEEQMEEEGSEELTESQDHEEEEIMAFFEEKTREQLQPIVKRLNEIRNVKLCGGLGSCFTCRNKHIGRNIHLNLQMSKSQANVPSTMSQALEHHLAKFNQPDHLTPHSNQNHQYFQDNKEETLRKQYGAYFKKELSRIMDGDKPTQPSKRRLMPGDATTQTNSSAQISRDSKSKRIYNGKMSNLKKRGQTSDLAQRRLKKNPQLLDHSVYQSEMNQSLYPFNRGGQRASQSNESAKSSQNQAPFNQGLRVNSLIQQYQNNQNPSIFMVGNPGQKNFVDEGNREDSAGPQKAQTGINFHQPIPISDVKQYRGNGAILRVGRAADKHLADTQYASHVNALHRSQSYKLKMRQQTAGAIHKMNQDVPLDFESMQHFGENLQPETNQSIIDYVEMAHTLDQAGVQMTQYTHQQNNSKRLFENGRLSGPALSRQPLSSNQQSRSPAVQLKSGARDYKSNERRMLEAKVLLHNSNAASVRRHAESRESEQLNVILLPLDSTRPNQSKLELGHQAQGIHDRSILPSGYGHQVPTKARQREDGNRSSRLRPATEMSANEAQEHHLVYGDQRGLVSAHHASGAHQPPQHTKSAQDFFSNRMSSQGGLSNSMIRSTRVHDSPSAQQRPKKANNQQIKKLLTNAFVDR